MGKSIKWVTCSWSALTVTPWLASPSPSPRNRTITSLFIPVPGTTTIAGQGPAAVRDGGSKLRTAQTSLPGVQQSCPAPLLFLLFTVLLFRGVWFRLAESAPGDGDDCCDETLARSLDLMRFTGIRMRCGRSAAVGITCCLSHLPLWDLPICCWRENSRGKISLGSSSNGKNSHGITVYIYNQRRS